MAEYERGVGHVAERIAHTVCTAPARSSDHRLNLPCRADRGARCLLGRYVRLDGQDRPSAPNRDRAVGPAGGLRSPRRRDGGARGRRVRPHPMGRDGWAVRTQHHLRSGCHRRRSVPHVPALRGPPHDPHARGARRPVRGGRMLTPHRARRVGHAPARHAGPRAVAGGHRRRRAQSGDASTGRQPRPRPRRPGPGHDRQPRLRRSGLPGRHGAEGGRGPQDGAPARPSTSRWTAG